MPLSHMDEFFEECILGGHGGRVAAVGGASDARDEIARRCGDGEEWLGTLQHILPPPKGRKYLVLGPEEYRMVAVGEIPLPESPLMVDGAVALCGIELRTLPKAVVRGSVEVAECPFLEGLDISCTGWLCVTSCRSLANLRGEVFGPATVKSCPISRIGADFRVVGSLFIQMCRNMGSVNCEIGGGLEARGCGVVSTGPAFRARKHLLVDACEGFHCEGGEIGGVAVSHAKTSGGRIYVDRDGAVGGGVTVRTRRCPPLTHRGGRGRCR